MKTAARHARRAARPLCDACVLIAVVAAAEMAELENYDTFYVKRTLTAQEIFWKEFFGQAMTFVGKWQFANADTALVNEFKRVLKEFNLVNQLNDPKGTYVLCLPCDVE